MKHRHRWVVIPLVVLVLSSSAHAASAARGDERRTSPAAPFVPGRALVGVTGERAAGRSAITELGGRIVSFYEPGNLYVVRTPGAVPAFVDALRGRPGIRYAEPDHLVHALDVVPNDPRWSSQWDMLKIGMPAAWERSTGSRDIVVGVIDTGVDYTHPDLAGQMWVNPGESGVDALGRDRATNGVDDDHNGFVDDVYGADFVSNDGNPMDDNKHGTHVAGTIGAAGNDATGVAGINWQIRLMALKFLDASGSGSELNAVRAIDYAIANGALLTNNSWGGQTYSQALRDAIARARAANQIFVAAAGNDGMISDEWGFYPAGYELDNIVAVAATDQNDALASFSNRGQYTVDIAAPGVSILSTTPNDTYSSFNGTSMASPHVAGALALLYAADPAARTRDFRSAIDRLYATADRVAGLAGKVATGARLNVARLLQPDGVPPGPCTLTATAAGRTSVSLAWVAPGDDGATGTASRNRLSYRPVGASSWSQAEAPAPALAGSAQTQVVRALPPATDLEFSLAVSDEVGNTSTCTTAATTAAGVTIFGDGFEVPSVTAATWSATSGSWTAHAEAAHTGALGMSDSPSRNYRDSSSVSLWTTNGFSLAGALAPRLAFWHRYALEPGYDTGRVEISVDGGSTWMLLASFTGHQPGWAAQEISLASYAGRPNVRLRFRLSSDIFVNFDGWRIDDVRVTGDGGDAVPPAAPGALTATDPGTGGTVYLDWADNGESDLAGYLVYRREAATAFAKLTPTPVASSDYVDATASNGTTYTYVVRAVDTSGNVSEPSNEASATPSDVTPPAAPVGLTASGEDGFVDLDWADNAEADLAGYHVYRRTSGGAWADLPGVVAASAFSDTGVTNDVTYEYSVTAVDATGNESTRSPIVSATPHHPVVGSWAPTSVTVTKGTKLGDPVANLAEDDGATYRVKAYQLAAFNTDWYASVTLPVTASVSSRSRTTGRTRTRRSRSCSSRTSSGTGGSSSGRRRPWVPPT